MHIITANTWFKMTFMDFRRKILAAELMKHGLKDMGCDTRLEPLQAWVVGGRWSITCPNCGGGEYVWEEGWVICHSCFNGYMGHKFRRTVFPENRREIEALLIVRPLQKREWRVGETVEDLQQENEAHKDELLVSEPVPGSRQYPQVALSALGVKYGREASNLERTCEECSVGEDPPSDPTTEIEYLRENHPEKLKELQEIEAKEIAEEEARRAEEGGEQ